MGIVQPAVSSLSSLIKSQRSIRIYRKKPAQSPNKTVIKQAAKNSGKHVGSSPRHIKKNALKKQAEIHKSLGLSKADRKAENQQLTRILKAHSQAQRNEIKLAKEKTAKRKAGRLFNPKRAGRIISISKLLAPVLGPILYQLFQQLSALIEKQVEHTSQIPNTPVTPPTRRKRNLPKTSHPDQAVALLTRIESARHSVTSLEKKRVGDLDIRTFAHGTNKRLDDLSNAVKATSALPSSRRTEAQQSISNTLQSIEQELFQHLGVVTK